MLVFPEYSAKLLVVTLANIVLGFELALFASNEGFERRIQVAKALFKFFVQCSLFPHQLLPRLNVICLNEAGLGCSLLIDDFVELITSSLKL